MEVGGQTCQVPKLPTLWCSLLPVLPWPPHLPQGREVQKRTNILVWCSSLQTQNSRCFTLPANGDLGSKATSVLCFLPRRELMCKVVQGHTQSSHPSIHKDSDAVQGPWASETSVQAALEPGMTALLPPFLCLGFSNNQQILASLLDKTPKISNALWKVMRTCGLLSEEVRGKCHHRRSGIDFGVDMVLHIFR
jgi:hypothetical protein